MMWLIMFTNTSILITVACKHERDFVAQKFVLKHYTVQICSSFTIIINCVGKLFPCSGVEPHCLQQLDELKTLHWLAGQMTFWWPDMPIFVSCKVLIFFLVYITGNQWVCAHLITDMHVWKLFVQYCIHRLLFMFLSVHLCSSLLLGVL